MKVSNFIVKHKIAILLASLILMIPAIFGMIKTRVNYDMLTYLPSTMDTMVGQEELRKEFGKGAFSMVVVEGMDIHDVDNLKTDIEKIDHVDSVVWYTSFSDLSIPMEILPERIYNAFNADNSTLMVVFFDTGTSEDATLSAVGEIRNLAEGQVFVSGMSALVVDLKNLCESEEFIYVAIAVALTILAMLIFLDNWLTPFVFIASIGMAILLNLGSNIIFGEISFITKALAAVLQLAVTMDYSIFLWHSYKEELRKRGISKEEAMSVAISKTFSSVIGSSITTVAGFIALCFMSFTLGLDLGLVMAKGVVIGVIGCVTILPALILLFDKPLEKASHRSLIPNMDKFSSVILRIFPVLLAVFVLIIPPIYLGYRKASQEVYYDMGGSLPEDMAVVVANSKLAEEYHMESTHMVLVESKTKEQDVRSMVKELQDVDGVKYVLGLESLVGERIPIEFLPESVTSILKSDKWDLILIGSEYGTASDEVNNQISTLSSIVKKYDDGALLIGEAPAMKDMIETTDADFKVVNAISIIAIFVIIALVEKSLSLPFILIAVIEVAIFINLAISHFTGVSLPFIAPICISTIQLGATVDYAILMTTRYKTERISGKNKHDAVKVALSTSIPSIIVSGAGLFVATLGVAIYSDIDMISSICMLLSRGAIISVACVILILPAMFMLFDKLICKTTKEMKSCLKN